jgi:hypothetical protein
MKKFTLLFASLLCVAYIAVAQLKLYVYQNDGTRTEFVASTVDSIAFSTITDGPDQPDDPIKPVDPTNGHEYVDLGLPSGTKWATMNVGATSLWEAGSYFAWGETSPKTSYTEENYTYNKRPKTLPLSDDAANVNWGGAWRMPTEVEVDELVENCNSTYVEKYGHIGYVLTSKINGNSIYFKSVPAYETEATFNPNKNFNGVYYTNSCDSYWTVWDMLVTDHGCFYSPNSEFYLGAQVRPVFK